MGEFHVHPHQQKILDTSRVSKNSTELWCCQPRGFSPIRPAPDHPWDSSCNSRHWPTGYKSKISTAPSLSSINFLKWLTGLGGSFYLLEHLLEKEHLLWPGTARWRETSGKDMGRGTELQCPLQVPHSPQILMCSLTQKLFKPHLQRWGEGQRLKVPTL